MTQSGTLQLRDYPTDVVRLACTRCDRKDQYRKAALMVRFGKYMTLPDLRVLLANCDRHGKFGDACGGLLRGISVEKVGPAGTEVMPLSYPTNEIALAAFFELTPGLLSGVSPSQIAGHPCRP